MVDTVSLKRCSESSGRMASLQARKQALQEKLAARNEELRRLCIQEAELTGSMPPEVPLEPGESPPPFRRVVGTGFAYPQNLINKLKTSDIESIAALELEKQVQVGISEAALGLVHNGAASKAARRKNRLVYQQSQKRLSELDERLGYLMAARSTVTSEQQQPQHSKNMKQFQQSPQNSQINTLTIPQYSSQQLHASNATMQHTLPTQQTTKYKKKPRPATIDIDKSEHRSIHIPYDDNHSGHYSTHSSTNSQQGESINANSLRSIYSHDRLERTTSAVHSRQQVQLAPHQQYDTGGGLGGYWMCLDTGETVWCSVEPNYWQRETRFGSLDRSKARPLQHKWSVPSEIETEGDLRRHLSAHASSSGHIKTMPDLSKHHRIQSKQDMYNTLDGSKSTENWHIMQAHSLGNVASQSVVDSPTNLNVGTYRDRAGSKKFKQKKWYETSLDQPMDNSNSSTQSHTGSLESMLPPHSPYHHSPLTTPTKQSHLNNTNTSQTIITQPALLPIVSTPSPHPPTPPTRVSALDLPLNTALDHQTSPFPNNNNNTVQVQSPKNCTVIQAGQWKPYREVTKPFEMSDFYKYSTKFRNRNNINNNKDSNDKLDESNFATVNTTHQLVQHNQQQPLSVDTEIDVTDSVGPVYHKGIYQPLQPMKCQPYHYGNSSQETQKLYSNSSIVPSTDKSITSHQTNIAYGKIPSVHHMYANTHSTNIKNSMPTSTLV